MPFCGEISIPELFGFHLGKIGNSSEPLNCCQRNWTIMMFFVPEQISSKGAPVNNIVQRAMTDKANPPGSPNAGAALTD